jgi:nucleotide-binding universal stress UspA family protein
VIQISSLNYLLFFAGTNLVYSHPGVQRMKRIMAVLETSETPLWQAVHAVNLANRLGGKVFILRILPLAKSEEMVFLPEGGKKVWQRRLDDLIDQARSQGISVDYHIAYGSYEDELVRFIRETKIDILVLIAPNLAGSRQRDRSISLESVRHRVNCRIELVYEKPDYSLRS